jgi:hypothetical protein
LRLAGSAPRVAACDDLAVAERDLDAPGGLAALSRAAAARSISRSSTIGELGDTS